MSFFQKLGTSMLQNTSFRIAGRITRLPVKSWETAYTSIWISCLGVPTNRELAYNGQGRNGIIDDSRSRKVKPDFAQYGFVHQENLIMACIGGSQAHGAKLGETDDTDWYGLYIPPPTKVLGLEREEHFVSRPAANSEVTGH